MYFGVAKDIITPPFNIPLACSGDFSENFKYIHDDVFVRCLVIDDGKNKSVLMAFDILFHDRCLNFALEEYAKEKYGIEPSAFVVGSTHTHIGPASTGYNQIYASDEYEEFMLHRSKDCLDRAMCSMFEGTIEHTSFEAFFNICRRGYKNGVFAHFPDSNHKRDTQFSLLIVRDTCNNVRSVVMNYGCHPVFYPANDSIGGEFPARVCQLIDTNYYGCTSLYFQSAGGDVRPSATVKNGEWVKPLPFSHLDNYAHDMAKAVIDNIEQSREPLNVKLASDSFVAKLELNVQPRKFFEDKYEDYKKYGMGNINFVNAKYIAAEGGYEKLAHTLDLHCQTIKLTDNLYIATIGGEPTNRVKECVKAAFGDKKIFFIGYTDSCAYVASNFEIEEGGYEGRDFHNEYRLIGPFKQGVDEALTKGYKSNLENLK